jgi:hypothetical protein
MINFLNWFVATILWTQSALNSFLYLIFIFRLTVFSRCLKSLIFSKNYRIPLYHCFVLQSETTVNSVQINLMLIVYHTKLFACALKKGNMSCSLKLPPHQIANILIITVAMKRVKWGNGSGMLEYRKDQIQMYQNNGRKFHVIVE